MNHVVEELTPADVIDGDIPQDPDVARRGMSTNTRQIQHQLNTANGSSNGIVTIPPGTYWVTTLSIPSDTELHLSPGATLKAWPYLEDYEMAPSHATGQADSRHDNVFQGYTLIRSRNTVRSAITGRGIIDGSGFAFWDIPIREYVAQGGTQEELGVENHWEDDSPFWREREPRLSPLIEFVEASQVLLRDVEIRNAAGWTVHPIACDDVTIDNVTITNHFYGPNTDGIDINGCRDVTIRGCRVRCGDDAIILKASKEAGRSCERIIISDCLLETHCAAIGIGAEVTYPIRDVSVSNIVVGRALRMVQIELWDAGLVEHVVIQGMTGSNMTDIPLERPVYVDIQHHGRTDGNLGAVRDIQVRGVSAITRGRCLFTAADGATIAGLQIDGLQLTIPEIEDPEAAVPTSRSNQMSNDNPETRARRAAIILDNVSDATLSGIQIRWPHHNDLDVARSLRPDFDRGDLANDRRKQASLGEEPPMNAFLLRNCREVHIDAPHVRGFKTNAIAELGVQESCIVRCEEIHPHE